MDGLLGALGRGGLGGLLRFGLGRRRTQGLSTLAVERSTDQAREERVRARWARAELGVGLSRDVVRVDVAGKLDELDKLAIRGRPREHQSRLGELTAVRVVDFVAVPV